MSTLAEIEAAAELLPPEEQKALLTHIAARLDAREKSLRAPSRQSAFDLPPLNLGKMTRLPGSDDDLLDEMLDGTRF